MTLYVTGKIVEVASCTSCTYTYKDSVTPTVTAISSATITGGDSITITGT